MKRSMTDFDRFCEVVLSGRMQSVVRAYSIGMRTTAIQDALAEMKVWADNSGYEAFELRGPDGMSLDEWHKTLSELVGKRLGDMRCLDCQGFFQAINAATAFVGVTGSVKACVCVHCGSNVTESLGYEQTTNSKG